MRCDGLGALLRCTEEATTRAVSSASANQRYSLLDGKIHDSVDSRTRYKGHHDDNPFAVLDRWATLNVEMDFKAKLNLAQHTDPSLHDSQFGVTGEPWALWIGDGKICCDPDQHVTDHIRGDICRGYWVPRIASEQGRPPRLIGMPRIRQCRT